MPNDTLVDQVILAVMSANLCVESHLRELLGRGAGWNHFLKHDRRNEHSQRFLELRF